MSDDRAPRRTIIRATRATLRDGTRVIIRPVREEDARHATAFFSWLSEETRYLRFMYPVRELTPDMVRGALLQEGLRRVSLVVEPVEGVVGDPPAVALGRYAPTADPIECEVALVVGDSWHGRGVGGALLTRLFALARRGGYRAMSATALSTNAKMIGLARSFGFTITEQSSGVTVMHRALVPR